MLQAIQDGLCTDVRDEDLLEKAVESLRHARVVLPTLSELATPSTISEEKKAQIAELGRNQRDPLNLFRIHWYNNSQSGSLSDCPEYFLVPEEVTGVEARIVVVPGDTFPLIGAHKVLPAYACLVAQLVTGQFDPSYHRAIWPSTGNYCRGGVAISRILNCRGVAVLPEGMSRERFDWLERWVLQQDDIIATVGTESNVKEIYDACNELAHNNKNVIFNQFSQFANYLAHFHVTGRALARVFEDVAANHKNARLSAFVAASGSAGTLAAGDYLKEQFGSLIVAVEALECPTMLSNGFGEHNIQGIGDKHIPLIHNVMNSDYAIAVSDRSTDALNVLFNSDVGRRFLAENKQVPEEIITQNLSRMGLSSIANMIAAIKLAKHRELGPDDTIMVVATDGSSLYRTEQHKTLSESFGGEFQDLDAAEVFGQHLRGQSSSHTVELTREQRERVFNLGYYTWVEQQGIPLEDFVARRSQEFWRSVRSKLGDLDELITETNLRIASGH